MLYFCFKSELLISLDFTKIRCLGEAYIIKPCKCTQLLFKKKKKKVSINIFMLIYVSEWVPEYFPLYFQVCFHSSQSTPGDPPLHSDTVFACLYKRLPCPLTPLWKSWFHCFISPLSKKKSFLTYVILKKMIIVPSVIAGIAGKQLF